MSVNLLVSSLRYEAVVPDSLQVSSLRYEAVVPDSLQVSPLRFAAVEMTNLWPVHTEIDPTNLFPHLLKT